MISFFFANCKAEQEIKSIRTQELKTLLAKESIQLLDVRTPKEIFEGTIKTAIFANYFEEDFYTKATRQLDKAKPVYVYCKSGRRSGISARILQENGYDVSNILGGYQKWKQKN
jgi:rhodanese-related sulfurtransferase